MRFPALGVIYALPSGAAPTPVPIAIAKEVSPNFKIKKTELNGQWKWAIDVAEFVNSLQLKFKNCDFRGNIFGMVFGAATSVTGQTLPATGEAQTVPGTPFAVTVTNSANFAEDGGVLDYTAGKWLKRIADGTAHGAVGTGNYSLTTPTSGVYTFADADTAHNLSIVYAYTSTAGLTYTLNNSTMGASTPYAVRVYNQYTINGAVKAFGFKFPAVHFSDLAIAIKSEAWAEQDLTGIVAQDPNSQLVLTHFVGD